MSKPRIRWYPIFGGGWFCSLRGGRPHQPVGVGKTPIESFDDWLVLSFAWEVAKDDADKARHYAQSCGRCRDDPQAKSL